MNEPRNDDDLRALLHDTAAGITPHGSFEEIKERAMTENGKRRWIWPSVAVAAVVALLVGGVGFLLRDDDTNRDVAAPPTASPTGAATASPDPEESTRLAPVYFVGPTTNGPRLFGTATEVTTCGSRECLLLAAVSTAVNGPVDDQDLDTPWSRAPRHDGMVVTTDGEEILIDFEAPEDAASPVDLAGRPAGMDALTAELAVQQLVYTARASLGEDLPVRFRINHENTATVLGVATAEPLTAADADEIQAPVQIVNLAEGQTLPAGKVEVAGVAAAFEANVLWELEDATGTTIDEGFTTAEECCTLAPYSFTLDLEPGTYTVVVHDEDMSGQNRPVNEDTKTIVVE